MALTEHGNVSSHVKLNLAANQEKLSTGDPNPAYGMKPIFGVELYTAQEEKSRKKNHLTVLAADLEGYRNMLRLVSRTFAEGFYFLPTANEELLDEHVGGLVVMSGCQSGYLFTALVGGKMIDPKDASYKRAKEIALTYKRRYGDNYFIEVQAFPELVDTCRANPGLARLANELNIPLVATMDVHYTLPSDRGMQMVLHNIRGHGKETLEEQVQSWGYNVALCPPLDDASIIRRLVATGLTKVQAQEAVLSTEKIAQECTVELPKLPLLRYPVSKADGSVTDV
jgi:DNA polymerase-3 subunit alpha